MSHPQLGVVFALAPSLCSFWSYLSTEFKQHIGHLPPCGVHLSVPYLFVFSYCSCDLKARNLKWIAIAFSSRPCSVRTLHHDPFVLVALHSMAHSFMELDKAMAHVIRLVNFLWLWFSFCLSSAEGNKRLIEASCWERLVEGETVSSAKKAEIRRIDAFELWYWRRLLGVPWTARRPNLFILKEISPEYSLGGLMLKLKLQCFGYLAQELTHSKRP